MGLTVLRRKEHVKRDGDEQTEVEATHQAVDYELHEVFIVSLAYTVVDPRAVMVHLEDAGATLLAVVCAHRLPAHGALLAALKHLRFDAVWHQNFVGNLARV